MVQKKGKRKKKKERAEKKIFVYLLRQFMATAVDEKEVCHLHPLLLLLQLFRLFEIPGPNSLLL